MGLSIPALLERVRGRQRSQLRREAAAWTGTLLLLMTWVGVLVAPGAPNVGRGMLGAAVLASLVLAIYFARTVTRRRVGDLFRTARWVGERLPNVSLGLLGAVELEQQLKESPDFSPSLARAHLLALARDAASLDLSKVVDERPLRRARRVLLVCILVVALSALAFPMRWNAGWGALGPRRTVVAAVDRTPITGEVEVIYRYPAYTGLATRTVPGTNGEVSAPVGTEVDVKTRSDRNVQRAAMVLNGQPVPLRVSGGRELSGTFVAAESGSYHFIFTTSSGRILAEGPDVAVQVEPDRPPSVTLLTPAEELEVRPDERLTLKYQAQDDYGLTGLALVYRHKGQEKRIKLTLEDRKRAAGQYLWDLKNLAAEEGDRITYVLEATDNDAVAGPQHASSRAHVLKVYSAAEHQRQALLRARALLDRLVLQLGDRMESPDRLPGKTPELVAGGARVDDAGWALAREMMDASADLRREKDPPAGLGPALAHLAEGLRERLRDTSTARRELQTEQRLGFSTGGAHLAAAAQADVAGLERDVLYLEALLQQHQLAALKVLARKVEAERRQLTTHLEEYRKTKDPAAQQALLKQIRELRARLDEMMREMAQLGGAPPDEHLSPEALAAESRDLGAELNRIEELVKQGKADDALAELQKLSMELSQMEQGVEQSSGSGMTDPQLTADFQAFQKELQETTAAQKKLAASTKTIRDRYREQRQQRVVAQGERLRDQLLKETQALEQDYREVPPDQLSYPAEARRQLEEARSEVQNLEGALKAQDFELAAEAAQRVRQSAQQLAMLAQFREDRDLAMNAPPDTTGQSQELARKLAGDAQRADSIERQLSELFPPSGQMMSEGDRQTLKGQAQGQRDLARRADGLRKRMEELQKRAPIFGQDAQSQMEGISGQMGQAGQALQAQEPGLAHAGQRAALEGLQQFAERMRQSQRQGGGGPGMQLPMPMGDREGGPEESFRDMSHERVEIPDVDDSRAPREFRKDLLEAMKQGMPERYRDQVKQYYEELVR